MDNVPIDDKSLRGVGLSEEELQSIRERDEARLPGNGKLPKTARLAMMRVFLGTDYSLARIGKMFNVAPQTVKYHIRRTLRSQGENV